MNIRVFFYVGILVFTSDLVSSDITSVFSPMTESAQIKNDFNEISSIRIEGKDCFKQSLEKLQSILQLGQESKQELFLELIKEHSVDVPYVEIGLYLSCIYFITYGPKGTITITKVN